MTTLPIRPAYAVAFGTPVVPFLGVPLAQYVVPRGAVELKTKRRNEKTMRSLRWAAELSVVSEDRIANLGVQQL